MIEAFTHFAEIVSGFQNIITVATDFRPPSFKFKSLTKNVLVENCFVLIAILDSNDIVLTQKIMPMFVLRFLG